MSFILLRTCSPCFSQLLPKSNPFAHPPPLCPCGAKRLLINPDGNPVCMAYVPFHHVSCSVLTPWLDFSSTREALHLQHHTALLRHVCCQTGDCWVFHTCDWWPFFCCHCLLLLHGFGVTMKFFPHACRYRLVNFPCLLLITLQFLSFNLQLLFNFNSIFCHVFSDLSFFFSYSFSSLLAWTQKERWPWSCVWSRVELICWDRLQWEKIVYPSFSLFIKTQDFSVEKSGILLCFTLFPWIKEMT